MGATSDGTVAYAFGEFTLDVGSRTLRRDAEIVTLPSRALDALLYLVRHRDRLVRKNELVEAVWHDVVVTDDSLIHAISVLRRALSDDPNQPRYVQTVPRRGYRFVAPVREMTAPGRQSARTAAEADTVGAPPRTHRRPARRHALAIGFAAAEGLLLLWLLFAR